MLASEIMERKNNLPFSSTTSTLNGCHPANGNGAENITVYSHLKLIQLRLEIDREHLSTKKESPWMMAGTLDLTFKFDLFSVIKKQISSTG